jgi:hypothetical protein
MTRINPKNIVQEPDSPIVAGFAGLSSATVNQGTDSIYLDKLINATITTTGEIKSRLGSKVTTILTSASSSSHVWRFAFQNTDFVLMKAGIDLLLFAKDNLANYQLISYKPGVFRNESANETPSFVAHISGWKCFVLIATKSTPLVCLALLSLNGTINSISGNSMSFSLKVYPAANNTLNTANTIIRSPQGTFHLLTSLAQTNANVSVSSATPFSWASVGSTIRLSVCFWFWCADANYYPGNYLWNYAVRRNQIPLDVNVPVPRELADNPIINEPLLQDYTDGFYLVFKNNADPAQVFNWKADRKPTTADEWSQSDGSFLPGRGMSCNPTPYFISFGDLETGGQANTILIGRGRRILLGTGNGVDVSNVLIRVNTNPVAFPTFFSPSGWVTNGVATAFAVVNHDISIPAYRNPGVDTSAVVEIVLAKPYRFEAKTNLVNLEPTEQGAIQIGDGWIVPLYGYNYLANTVDHDYPNLVSVLGNRIVLSGRDNRVAFSHLDWEYRGISWNNFQVSSMAFSPASAYVVALQENCSKVVGFKSVFGILVVATDVGIFRISGESATATPSATSAVTVLLSREIAPSSASFDLFENKLFYISRNGLFVLEYNNDIQDLQNTNLAAHVSNYFQAKSPHALIWSPKLKSFLVQFSNTRELLQFNFDSFTWSIIKLATLLPPQLNNSFDGFTLTTEATNGSGSNTAIILCEWDAATTDLTGIASWSSFMTLSIPGTQQQVLPSPTEMSNLVTPAELISFFNTRCCQAEGDNHARVVGTSAALIVEHEGGMADLPIKSAFVTKAFTSDRLNRAHRIRACNLLLRGSGFLLTRLVLPVFNYEDRFDECQAWAIALSPPYQGNDLLNAAFSVRIAPGNSINLRIPMLGHAEAWQLACQFDASLAIVGLQFDTSRKGLRRTRL